MATVVSIMDRDDWRAHTDVIVVAEPAECLLTWVPRDLWCEGLGRRINLAFARGGHGALIGALAEHSLHADHSICLRRSVSEELLAGIELEVPVEEAQRFWYPLEPNRALEDGRREIAFEPPAERLAGTRVHEWLGARYRSDGSPSSDLHRIERQKTFVACAVLDGTRIALPPAGDDGVRLSGPEALSPLQKIDSSWWLETFDAVKPDERNGAKVLIARPERRERRRLRRISSYRRDLAHSALAHRETRG